MAGPSGAAGARGEAGPQGPEGGATPALASTLKELAATIDLFARRQFVSNIVIALLVLAVGLLVGGFITLRGVAETNRKNLANTAHNSGVLAQQQVDTNRLLAAVESVTGEQARASSAEATRALVTNLLAEFSCELRRHQAELSVTAPNQCRAQTPPEVYPGAQGSPPR